MDGKAISKFLSDDQICYSFLDSVFYRILKDDIDLHSIGLLEPPWRKSIPIYSLIFNTWSKDTRPLQERLHKPLVMDIGWTELDVSTLRPKTEVGSSSHFIPANNRRLGQGMAKAVSQL